MSTFEVRIPDLGDAQDVEIVEICIAVGDSVEIDEALLVIESDKATMELPSPAQGKVESINVNVGDNIEIDDLVVVLTVEREVTTPTESSNEDSAMSSEANIESAEEEPKPQVLAEPEPIEMDGNADDDATEARFEIRLPELGDVDEAEVVEVLVSEGTEISVEQALIVLESDKATMELPSAVSGVVESVAVDVGDKVTDNALIAVIRTSALSTSSSTLESKAKTPINTQVQAAEESRETVSKRDLTDTSQPKTKPAKQIYAGPAVRRLARELGVDLSLVEGTGAKNRIVKDDVKHYVKVLLQNPKETSQVGLPEVNYPDFRKFGEIEEVALTRIESRGAQNLVPSWLNAVHVTQHDETDVTELEEFRAELNAREEYSEVRLTILPFILKACATTLQAHPRFNASIHPSLDKLILKKYINIGMAVDTPDGLVVPVIRDVVDKGLREIAAEIENLSIAAREKRLKPQDMSGATFTVSSLGRLGGTGFTPIINVPELAILGVARLTTKPIWDGTSFVPRKVLPLSLSYDHRAINGADGGRFMQSLAEKLTDVRLLIL